MTTSKMPLLITLMMLGLQADVSLDNSSGIIDDSSKKTHYMLNAARNLQKKDNPDAKIAGKWLENKLIRDRLFYPRWQTIFAILTNDMLELNEKVAYILQVRDEQKKQHAQVKSKKYPIFFNKELIIFCTTVAVISTAFAPFIFAGAQIGEGFGKYIREQLWPNLDVDKSGWN